MPVVCRRRQPFIALIFSLLFLPGLCAQSADPPIGKQDSGVKAYETAPPSLTC